MARDRGGRGPTVSAEEGSLLSTVRNLWSYMWPKDRPDLQVRVILAIAALLASKAATTFVPFAYKGIVDSLDGTTPESALFLGLAIPIVLVVAYGVGNIIDAGFQQLRDVLFASVGQNAVRKLALQTFRHLHRMSLRFHLARRTGGLSRVIERGTKGIETIVRFTMLNTAPTLVEFVITGTIFIVFFGVTYFAIMVVVIWLYIYFTVKASNWRISIRRRSVRAAAGVAGPAHSHCAHGRRSPSSMLTTRPSPSSRMKNSPSSGPTSTSATSRPAS